MKKNSNIFKAKIMFSAYRPTDAINITKELLSNKITQCQNILKLNIAKNVNLLYSIFKNRKGSFRYGVMKLITHFLD